MLVLLPLLRWGQLGRDEKRRNSKMFMPLWCSLLLCDVERAAQYLLFGPGREV